MDFDIESENDESSSQRNPTLPVDMVQDASQMRGDAIGDTLYSERWVLKTLMKLTKSFNEGWSKELDTDLCLLWDMTFEADVINLLMKHNILGLATYTLSQASESRLVEIMIGILGNLCCDARVRDELRQSLPTCQLLLNLLAIPDVPTLIQLVRVLQACIWDSSSTEEKQTEETQSSAPSRDDCEPEDRSTPGGSFLQLFVDTNTWYPHLKFILQSCTDETLLCSTLELLDNLNAVIVDEWPWSRDHTDAVNILLEAMEQLHQSKGSQEDDFSSDKRLDKAASHWVSLLASTAMTEAGEEAIRMNSERVAACLCVHLRPHWQAHLQDTFISDAIHVMAGCFQTEDKFHDQVFKRFLALLTYLREDVNNHTDSMSVAERTTQNNLECLFENILSTERRSPSYSKRLAQALAKCKPEHVATIEDLRHTLPNITEVVNDQPS